MKPRMGIRPSASGGARTNLVCSGVCIPRGVVRLGSSSALRLLFSVNCQVDTSLTLTYNVAVNLVQIVSPLPRAEYAPLSFSPIFPLA